MDREPQTWQVVITPEVRTWLRSLGRRDAQRISASLDRLREHGPGLRRPTIGTIDGSRYRNMRELRSVGGHLRALFAFDPQQRAIVLVGGDKTNNWNGWYRTAIRVADERMDHHLRSLGGGASSTHARTAAGRSSEPNSR